jgi:hypothetical protein
MLHSSTRWKELIAIFIEIGSEQFLCGAFEQIAKKNEENHSGAGEGMCTNPI